ncbi:MAG: hypothetical protein IJE28_01640 [Oscillospiraceae bacterium]|nr:hypothetical protein [Oscillospiraceae bacterium]MBQ4642698.1 hypothetical protein [Oscillospiraceae bacterium]
MKKKAKKQLFDPRLPGAKMIFYGAILLLIAGCINAFFSWVFVVGTYLGAAELGDVFGSAIATCLMVAVAFLVAVDGINHRNHPSKARSIILKAVCAFVIAVAFMLQFSNFEEEFWGVVAAGITMGGSVIMAIGAFRNAKMAGGKK